MNSVREPLGAELHGHFSTVQPFRTAYSPFECPRGQAFVDWCFWPELQSEAIIEDAGTAAAREGSEDLSDQVMLKELNRAIKLGLDVKAYYTVRVLLSFKLRMSYLGRNWGPAADIVGELGDCVKALKPRGCGIEFGYSFYYVEARITGSAPAQRIYCVMESDVDVFITQLKARRYANREVRHCREHGSQCRWEGVCVIPLEERSAQPQAGREREHAWCEFGLKESATTGDVVTVGYLRTKDRLPGCSCCAPVYEARFESKSRMTFTQERVRDAIAAVQLAAEEGEQWFQCQVDCCDAEFPVSLNFLIEVDRFDLVLTQFFDGQESVVSLATRLQERERRSVLTSCLAHLDRLMKIYRRTMRDVKSDLEKLQQGAKVERLPYWEQRIRDWIKAEGLSPISNDVFAGFPSGLVPKFQWLDELPAFGEFLKEPITPVWEG